MKTLQGKAREAYDAQLPVIRRHVDFAIYLAAFYDGYTTRQDEEIGRLSDKLKALRSVPHETIS